MTLKLKQGTVTFLKGCVWRFQPYISYHGRRGIFLIESHKDEASEVNLSTRGFLLPSTEPKVWDLSLTMLMEILDCNSSFRMSTHGEAARGPRRKKQCHDGSEYKKYFQHHEDSQDQE